MLPGECCEFALIGLGGKALDAVVARMHFHDQGGLRPDGVGKITQMCAVGGADLAKPTARPRHDVGQAK